MPSGTEFGAAVAVRNVRVSYPAAGGALPVLEDVSLALAPGEFCALIGPSGCGKSTLLRVVAGLQPPQSGSVEADGAPVRALRREKALGMVFQDPALLPWQTVLGNARLPALAGRRGPPADAMVERVGLGEFKDYYPRQLSGGMRQRAALARAFAGEPRLLLMDEPFGALDDFTREEMRSELLRTWESERTTVLFVTHSMMEAILLADRVMVMSGRPGRMKAEVRIDFPRPRTPELEGDPLFRDYLHRLRAHLRE